MGKIKDLTGQKFGKLTVLEATPERRNRQVVWKCQCECGNITYVVGQALRDGHTQSCGCKALESKNYNNLINQRFGNLVVIKPSSFKTSDRHMYWDCQCDCGNIRTVRGTDLVSGKITMCYNCQTHKTLAVDLTGQKFGKLLVLSPLSTRDKAGHIMWKCQCDCGNLCEVSSNKLQSYAKTSCGCIKTSNGEDVIANLLTQAQIHFKKQVSFNDCLSPKNAQLFFDFGIYDDKNQLLYLIEYDGLQHFEPVEYFGGETEFEYRQQCDMLKNQYCNQKNIKLIRIPYTKLNTITIQDLLI